MGNPGSAELLNTKLNAHGISHLPLLQFPQYALNRHYVTIP